MSRVACVLTTLCFIGMNLHTRTASAEEGGGSDAASNGNAAATADAAANVGAAPATASLEDGNVTVSRGTDRTALSLPAKAVAIFQHRDTLYVALGRQGAMVFDISSPKTVHAVQTISAGAEEVTGFALVDGGVWMRMVSTKIVPLAGPGNAPAASGNGASAGKQGEAVAADAAPAKKSPTPISRPISILKVENGQATLDVGSADGVQIGDQFSVFRSVTMRGAKQEAFAGTELAAVVEVIAVNEHRCLVSLWRGDRVTAADTVEQKTKDHHRSMVFPRHLTDLGQLSVTLRPILNVDGPIGFGALNNLSVSYWGKHYFVGLVLDPVAFAVTDGGNMGLMNGAVEAGFNSRAFAIGVGAGVHVARFNSPGFATTQTVRLGAKDGLNWEARNTFFLRRRTEYNWDNYSGRYTPSEEEVLGFEWGGLSNQLNIPLGSRLTLFFGGGGSSEWFYGEGGVHAWLRGNGDRGSIGLSAAAGAAGLFASNYDNNDYYYDNNDDEINISAIGPMIALSMDWRFGFR